VESQKGEAERLLARETVAHVDLGKKERKGEGLTKGGLRASFVQTWAEVTAQGTDFVFEKKRRGKGEGEGGNYS